MDALGETLGYHRLALSIAEDLGESPTIRVIKGPPGVGKSWLARGVGSLWQSAGGAVVFPEGDPSRSDQPLSPFGIAMDEALDANLEALASAIAALAKAGEVLIGTGGALTTAIEALVRLQSARGKTPTPLLDRSEQEVLARLAKLGRKRPLLVIADNLHWWDSASLDFLNRLRDDRICGAFKFLREMRILAVETPEPHQAVAHPEARDRLLRSQAIREYPLGEIPREGFEDVLVGLGAPERPSAEVADLIHRFSGGHLVLASRCAMRLREDDADSFLSAETPDEFVRGLLGERVRTMGASGREALGVLQVAAVSGLTFRRDTLDCATDGDTAKMLRYCRKEQLLDVQKNGIGRFVHEFYRQYFLDSLGESRIEVHEVLDDCLRKLDSGNYEARCVNAIAAELWETAPALGVQTALQRQREGLDWRALPDAVLDAIEQGGLTQVTERFENALQHLNHYRAIECLQALADLGNELPESLAAEADYLRAVTLTTTRSGTDRRTARILLETQASMVDLEPELGLRLMRQRLYQLALEVDKEPALRLEGELRQALQKRQGHDRAARDALYTLDRLAGSTQRAGLALEMNRRAVRYFGPSEEGDVLARPVEYYLSLVNLGATLVGEASYDEAEAVHRTIDSLLAEYEQGVFPRVDYPKMNGLLAQHRAGTVDIDDAVRRQQMIVAAHAVPDDPFFVENALAVYLTLAGSSPEALDIFDRLTAQLQERTEPEPSFEYLVRGNRCGVLGLTGQVEAATAEWGALADVVTRIPYDTRPEMVRRHELLAEAMASADRISPEHFDRNLLADHGFCVELGYGFWMPAVEWWR